MRRICTYGIVFSVFLILFTQNTHSATECVSTDTQLRLALYYAALSPENDVIQIVQGSYGGGFVYSSDNSSNLILEGGYTSACALRVADRTNTILDGENNERVLSLSSTGSAEFSLDSVTIQNGNWTDTLGGGMLISTNEADVSITGSIFKNNLVDRGGGGGLYVNPHHGDVLISGNIFSDNDSRVSSGGNGGGLYINTVNTATVTTNEFLRNQGGSGGGVAIFSVEKVIITDNIFDANDGYTNRGGSIYATGRNIFIDNNTIINAVSGGGIDLGPSGTQPIITTVTNNVILNNAEGPGIRIHYVHFNGVATIVNNIIAGNSSESVNYGGGLQIGTVRDEGTLIVTNNTITDNYTPGHGGGLSIRDAENDGAISIYSNIIWNNVSAGEGNDIYINDDQELDKYFTPISMFNNDFDQSEDGFYIFNPVFVDLLDISNINNVNPSFVSGDDNYHLNTGSLCINEGNNLAPGISLTDVEGNSRIMDGAVDMGAYESSGPVLPVAVFEASPLSGQIPLTVNFSDQSIGEVTTWAWDFGDGQTSSDQSPTNVYSSEGSYTVSLIVTGSEGSTTEIKNGLITVALTPPVAAAGMDRVISQHNIILDGSASTDVDGSIVSYEWELNHRVDGAYNQVVTGISHEITDLHSGIYDVQLLVTDDDGLTSVDTLLLAVSEPWDVNNDQTLGLEEVIYILSILTGE